MFTEGMYSAAPFECFSNKMQCHVEFNSLSIGNAGNYYFIVSLAENGSWESVYISYSAVVRWLPLRLAFCLPAAFV